MWMCVCDCVHKKLVSNVDILLESPNLMIQAK